MKVKELIEKLSELDQDTEIYINDSEYGEESIEDIVEWYKAELYDGSYTILRNEDVDYSYWNDRGNPVMKKTKIYVIKR